MRRLRDGPGAKGVQGFGFEVAYCGKNKRFQVIPNAQGQEGMAPNWGFRL